MEKITLMNRVEVFYKIFKGKLLKKAKADATFEIEEKNGSLLRKWRFHLKVYIKVPSE